VALTLVVLTGAGLLMKSLLTLQRTATGFDPAHVLTLRISPPQSRWDNFSQLGDYYERVLAEVRREPGVASVALNCSSPLSGIALRYPFWSRAARSRRATPTRPCSIPSATTILRPCASRCAAAGASPTPTTTRLWRATRCASSTRRWPGGSSATRTRSAGASALCRGWCAAGARWSAWSAT